MFASLRSRLALSNLLITLLGLAVLVFVTYQLLDAQGTQIKERDRSDQAKNVAAGIESLFERRALTAELDQFVDTASRVLGARIILVSPTGVFRVDSKEATPYFTGSWTPLDRRALIAGENAKVTVRSGDLVRFQSPILGTHGHVVGAVLLVTRVTDVRPSPDVLQRVILIAAGTALLVWLVIGFYFAFSISRPLLRITRATREMAWGNYGARVDMRADGEIGRLASSFDSMAQQVQQTNQVLKDFLANVSHDLRTPLTMIAGFSQALLDGTARSDDVEGSAVVIHDEAVKMQHLVDDLLQLTRLESGLLTLDRHPTEVRAFIQRGVDGVGRAPGRGNAATIRNVAAADLPLIDVDAERLERALRNLLDNALRSTPAEGRVTVAASRISPGWVEISVTDTGCGIPAAELPRIFERFYRSDKSRERVHGHSGLGLAIVREIVEAHGGMVTVDSALGQGSTFRFTVPEARGLPREAEAPARESIQQAATQ